MFVLQVIVLLATACAASGLAVLPIDKWIGQRLLFIYAHIDDMEAASGGLVALLKYKADIHILVMTNGDKGCGNPELCGNRTNAELAQIREGEQFQSASMLGIPKQNVIFLEHEDCLLETYPVVQVEQEVVRHVRRVKPHVVITWDPVAKFEMISSQGWGDMGYHPDHQTSGQLALDSVWVAHLDRLWTQLGAGWKVNELYFWAFTPARVPDFYLDVTGAPYKTKTQAFLAMQSQYPYNDSSGMTTFLDFLSDQSAKLVGLPEGHKAEGYNYILW